MPNHVFQKLSVLFCFGLLALMYTNSTITTFPTKTPAELKQTYVVKIKSTIDFWLVQDLSAYTTGHICKATTVSGTLKNSYVGQPYLTPKLHNLARLMHDLGKIHPYMDLEYKNKIKNTLIKLYFWFYRRIDWSTMLIADDYGLCYKGIAKSYSHLTTALVVQGFLELRRILPATDPNYAKLSSVTESLSASQLISTDSWMTPVDQTPNQFSANFMGLNLSTVSVLNSVNPNNTYVVNNLDHRLRSDYAWIRSSFVNYATEISCGIPLLYGGWSHQTFNLAVKSYGVSPSCNYFDQNDKSSIAVGVRSYYLQKVSYHTFIATGLMNLFHTLISRSNCSLVNYGSQGTCSEIKTILKGAATWLYFMLRNNGTMPSAFQSLIQDEFGYFSDNGGSSVGITNLIQILNFIKTQEGINDPAFRYGFVDQVPKTIYLSQMKERILMAINYMLNNTSTSQLAVLQDAPFLVEILYK